MEKVRAQPADIRLAAGDRQRPAQARCKFPVVVRAEDALEAQMRQQRHIVDLSAEALCQGRVRPFVETGHDGGNQRQPFWIVHSRRPGHRAGLDEVVEKRVGCLQHQHIRGVRGAA